MDTHEDLSVMTDDVVVLPTHEVGEEHPRLRGGEAMYGRRSSPIELAALRLSKARLTYAALYDASLVDADLTGANLTNADLRGANFANADMPGADCSNLDCTYINVRQALKDAGAVEFDAPID